MSTSLIIDNKDALKHLKNCAGEWRFDFFTTYVLCIKARESKIEIMLLEEGGKEWILSHLKSSAWYTELFAFNEDFDDAVQMRIYGCKEGRLGVEVSTLTTFFRESSEVQISDSCQPDDFEALHDRFPKWIQGVWYNTSLSLRMRIILRKHNVASICIEHEDENASPSKVSVIETAYIGYSGMYMALDCHYWVDRPILYEFIFDARAKRIHCVIKMTVDSVPNK